MRYVVLLRGVNVGPHKRLSMADLRAALSVAGFGEVRTYLQSGNIVLDSDLSADETGAEVGRVIADRLGARTDVLVRTPAELAAAIAADPFGDLATDPSRHVLGFLATEPDSERIADLQMRIALRPAGADRHAFRGRHFYLWCPNGISRSPYFTIPWDRLGVSSTQRNWNTVTALLEMATG